MEISELEKACVRLEQEEKAAEKLAKARARLVMCKPAQRGADPAATVFLATLCLRLTPEVDWSADTAWTDGRRLGYNPEFVCSLTDDELLGVTCHEVMHAALAHMSRQGAREPELWNTAADLAVNSVLDEARIKLPADALRAGTGDFAKLAPGLSAEEYYAALQRDEPPEGGGDQPGDEEDEDGQGGEGQGPPDPGRCGAVKPPEGGPAEAEQAKHEWQAAAAQAAEVAKQRGALPGGVARLVEGITNPQVPWRDVLREFVSRRARGDYSWSSPNRRLICQGLYLPGLLSEELGDVVIAVDTSGSVTARQLAVFASEMEGVLETFPGCVLTILYHDSKVQHVHRWSPSDGPLKLEPKGGGGTDHRPVFEWVERQAGDAPCLICFTDCYTVWPALPPATPTLWACVNNKNARPPFGAVIHVEA